MTDKITAGYGYPRSSLGGGRGGVRVSSTRLATPTALITALTMAYSASCALSTQRYLPPWHGTGSLSGLIPPYVVTYGGAGATCVLDLYDTVTGLYIMSTSANPTTGAFAFPNLNTARTFDVRARGALFPAVQNDMILAGLTPA